MSKPNHFTQLALASLGCQLASATVITFGFDTVGDTEGFTTQPSPANAVVTDFTAALGIDSITGVLTSSDISIDPQINGPSVALPAGEVWSSISFRFRHLDGNPQDGAASTTYNPNGTILFFNGSLSNLGTAAITTRTANGSGPFAGDVYQLTVTSQADNWQLATLDLSNAPVLNSGDITSFRFDPIGNNANGNFEVDFVEFTAVPEPSSALLAALASLSLLARRRNK